jgi:hypothetical protein
VGAVSLAVVALLAVTGVKLALAGVLGSSADVLQMRLAAEAFLSGKDLLDPANTGGNPTYLLLGHSFLSGACLLLARVTGLSFDFVVKLPAIISDLGVALLLRSTQQGGDRAALIYMANPLTILLSTYHGQLHTVALLGAVFALWLADRRRFAAGGVMLALAASVRQHYAALIVPLVRSVGSLRIATLLTFVGVLTLLNASLLWSPHPERLLHPISNYGLWGWTMLLLHGPRLLALAGFNGVEPVLTSLNGVLEAHGIWLSWLWAAVFGVWVWRRPDGNRWRAALLFMLGTYAVGTGFGVQRLLWALPFWVIVSLSEAIVYSVIGSAYVAVSYWQWTLNVKYGVQSVTAHLGLLAGGDFVVILLVSVFGFLTWLYCTVTAWRLVRA